MNTKLARALGVLFAFPFDARRDVHGVHSRVGLLLEALGAAADEVDLLVFAPRDTPMNHVLLARLQVEIEDRIGASTRLFVCQRSLASPRRNSRLSALQELLAGIMDLRRQPEFRPFHGDALTAALGRALERRPNVVLAHDLRTMVTLLQHRGSLPPVVLDVDNIEHRRFGRHLVRSPAWPSERLRVSWLPAMMAAEFRAYRLASRLLVCSDDDQAYLRRLGVRHATVAPNALELPPKLETTPTPQRILFIGRLDYGPNAHAVEYLQSRVWPAVIAAVPKAELWIAGEMPEEVRGFDAPAAGIRFLGFVDDLDDLYRSVRVVATPILVGGGTRFKLIEAAAYGKAIVSTTVGAEGLSLTPDSEIILRDSQEAFAEACIDLLNDEARAQSLGVRARERVEASYSRSGVIATIARVLHTVVDQATHGLKSRGGTDICQL